MKQINIYNFASEADNYRPLMTGVFHDNGTAVASNTMVLLTSTRDYKEECNGKVIGRKGEEIAQSTKHYPSWRAVIPKHYTGYYDKPFPMDKLREAVKHATDYLKSAPKFREEDGKRKRIQRVTRVVVNCGDFNMGFSYEQAKKLCTLPSVGEVVECEDYRRPIWYRNDAEGYQALLMPLVTGQDTWYELALHDGVAEKKDHELAITTFIS